MASREGSESLDGLVTESRRADADYSGQTTRALVELMNAEDTAVPAVVGSAAPAIAAAIDAVVERLGALGGDECEATCSTEAGQVVALVAGGSLASSPERESAEDDAEAG